MFTNLTNWIWTALVALLLLFFVGGCVATHNGDYSWGFKISTGYEFTQTAPDSKDATAQLDLQPAVDYIVQLKKDEANE